MSNYYSQHYDEDMMRELHSQFLIDSWSYSKVTAFARNEKAFEMQYIFNCRGRISSTTQAGNAYHAALDAFFKKKQQGETLTLVEMQEIAFDYIDRVDANKWKLQKTTPTVEECRVNATKIACKLLENFVAEAATYEDDIAEVLDVEVYCDEWLVVSGVDIPMPCHLKIDLVVLTKRDTTAVIDHKSKTSFTADDEMAMTGGVQAITYALGYESKTGKPVHEVWFVENKHSKNKDGAPQLNAFKIPLDENTRRLYEALLYEPLRKMISAVNDPDYVYLINDADNYVDRAELYDFWCRTQIAEVEDFNIAEAQKPLVAKRLKKIRDASIASINPKLIKEFKANAAAFIQYDLSATNMFPEEKIEHVLRSFSIIVKVAHRFEGYSSNTYLLEASAGVKLASIHSHRLDIANALDVANVRLSKELVVYEGKSYLGVEFARAGDRKELPFDPAALQGRRIPLGKDNFNNTVVWDLDNPSTPHMLMCGATGSGKSVELECIIAYAKQAGIADIIILDPKHEFTQHKSRGVKVYNEVEDIESTMASLVDEMNDRIREKKSYATLVVFDEFADALAQSRTGKELNVYEEVTAISFDGTEGKAKKAKREHVGTLKSLEENLRLLLQKGRSSGFRIVAATQRASVKVIGGDAKVNFPVQVCFRVPKEIDSKVVLDEAGAEALTGRGDGLIKSPEYPDTVRFQGYYKAQNSVVNENN